jgi:hypothetical protein
MTSSERMANPDSHTMSGYFQLLFAACLLILTTVAILYMAFLDRQIMFDETHLQNPPYMLLHYGRLTFPVHSQFDALVVHPPIHYLGMALFVWRGLSVFHAAAVMPILFFAAAGGLLLFSRMAPAVKFGLLFGIFLGALVWNTTYVVRPDLSLALAWIAGLIGLEAGRLADWDSKRLFAGSVLLAYATAAHYPGSFCWIGIFVYMVWVWFDLPRRQALRRMAIMMAGLGLIGIPYLLFFIIPYRHEIFAFITPLQGEGGPMYAFRRHIQSYEIWRNGRAGLAATQPFVQALLAPLWTSLAPAAFIGPPLLFVFRSTRGLALAALPQVLFIVFGARYKQLGASWYHTPEMMIYLAGAISVVLAGLFFLARHIRNRMGANVFVLFGVAGMIALVLHDKPSVAGDRVRFTRNLNDLDLGRAAAKDIAGPNAFIGSTSLGVWYTGGAAHFYMVSPEILYGPTLSIKNPREYFSRFDAIVADQQDSWVTGTKERATVTSFYLSGDLRLKGFWLADKRTGPESVLSWMMYAAKDGPVRGYAVRDNRMYRFDQALDGESVFFCAVCPITELRNAGQFDFYGTLFFPQETDEDPRTSANPTPVIRMLLVSKDQFQRDVLPAATHCKVRDQMAGRVEQVDAGAMLAQLRASDRTIRFYRSFPTALAGTNRLNSGNTTRIPGIVELNGLHALAAHSRAVKRGAAVYVATAPKLWWDAASSTINHKQRVEGGFIYVRGKVLSGVVGISVRGHEANTILGSEAMWGAHDGVNELYIPFTSFDESEQVVIRNQRTNGQSEVLIEDMSVVVEAMDWHRHP